MGVYDQSPQRHVSHLLARSYDRYVYCNAGVHLCVHEERMEGKDVLLLSSSLFFFLRKASTPPFNACTQKSFERTG